MLFILNQLLCVHLYGSRGHDLEILRFYDRIRDHLYLFQTSCGLLDESDSGRDGFLLELPSYVQRATEEKQMERWGQANPLPWSPHLHYVISLHPTFPWKR